MHSSRMRTAHLLTASRRGLPGGGCLPTGVSAWGVYPSMQLGRQHPPSPHEQNHRQCKNITLPQTSFAGGNNRFSSTSNFSGVGAPRHRLGNPGSATVFFLITASLRWFRSNSLSHEACTIDSYKKKSKIKTKQKVLTKMTSWNLSHYRSGTVNSNTVNSKFHLIRSFCEIFARFLSFHV